MHANETTPQKVLNQIRSKIKNASDRHVHIYSFNVHPEQLEVAFALLDKQKQRQSMRVTYSDDYNFVVRYMPGQLHKRAVIYWVICLSHALSHLMPPAYPIPPGLHWAGSTTFQVGLNRKEADSSIRPIAAMSRFPSVVLEVGDSESLAQLKIDARLWIEHVAEVNLVILLSISPPIAPLPNFPRITVQLWKCSPPLHPPHSPAAQRRVACMVWAEDWTQAATPLYLLLDDIYGPGQVPAEYGNQDHVQMNTEAWRQNILSPM
jgi:hypothetical protein